VCVVGVWRGKVKRRRGLGYVRMRESEEKGTKVWVCGCVGEWRVKKKKKERRRGGKK
jgi:hypothetical protein